MKIAVIGAGGMGGSFGALMAEAGLDVTLIDSWAEHVEAINRDGLLVEGALGRRQINVSDHPIRMTRSGPIGSSPLPIAT